MEEKGNLTKYPSGSLRELWHLALPLMLMTFSTFAMLFCDRLILAKYSIEAMNAVGIGGSIYVIFMFSFLSLAAIAEVFVGQYNGAKQEKRIGEPVWQMVWLALISLVVFWPIGLYMGETFIAETFWVHGVPNFKWIMLFGPMVPLGVALSSFFIGRGKPLTVTIVVAFGNIINVILDVFFVFGIEGYIPSMGSKGAAIATGIAQVLQALILLLLFLKKDYRERFGTWDYRFKWNAFWQCLKVGFPMAISHGIALAAWPIFFRLVAHTGEIYITTVMICQNYFLIYCFIIDGMGKAVTMITANLIGAQRIEKIPTMLVSAAKLLSIFAIILTIPLIIFPEPFINLFITQETFLKIEGLESLVKEALVWQWIIFIAHGLFWIFSSQLTAAGDTKFIMYLNILCAWLFLILPVYLLITVLGFSPELSWKIMGMELFILATLFFLRYRSGKWKTIQIIT